MEEGDGGVPGPSVQRNVARVAIGVGHLRGQILVDRLEVVPPRPQPRPPTDDRDEGTLGGVRHQVIVLFGAPFPRDPRVSADSGEQAVAGWK